MKNEKLPIIGSTTLVSIDEWDDVPAKIDTGADSSSVWVSHLHIDENGILKFQLFGEGSPFYNGKVIEKTDYKVAVVRSATGEEQVRYRAYFTLKIAGRKIKVLFNLSDRSANNFPILIGRRSLSGKFLVDVSRAEVKRPPRNPKSKPLMKELRENPRKFYEKYSKKGAK